MNGILYILCHFRYRNMPIDYIKNDIKKSQVQSVLCLYRAQELPIFISHSNTLSIISCVEKCTYNLVSFLCNKHMIC